MLWWEDNDGLVHVIPLSIISLHPPNPSIPLRSCTSRSFPIISQSFGFEFFTGAFGWLGGVTGAEGSKKRDLPRGVYEKPSGKYKSQIWWGGRSRTIGTHDAPEQASAAYLSVRKHLRAAKGSGLSADDAEDVFKAARREACPEREAKAAAREAELRKQRELRETHETYSVLFISSRKLGMCVADGGHVDKVREGSQAHNEFVRAGHVITKVGLTCVHSSTTKHAFAELVERYKSSKYSQFTIHFRKSIG